MILSFSVSNVADATARHLAVQHVLATSDPARLAKRRRAGTVCLLALDQLASRAQAEAFQAAAVGALGGAPCGYKIGATSVEVQRLLGCHEPIYSPILSEDVLQSGSTFRIPHGLLGIECEFGFVMGRDFPASARASGLAALRSAIAECFIGLELVGRRLADDVPLNEVSSIADFALHVAVIRGRPIPDWERYDLATMPVRAVVDGVTMVRSTGGMVLGHPLNALEWLAETLHRRGGNLRNGEIVLTGTCTGVTKVSPGQKFDGHFGDLPAVQVHLV
jgi:2-keto-4-pentenoate hydratase